MRYGWSAPDTSEADRTALGREIADAVPALRALDMFTVFEVRDESLRAFIAER